MRGSHDAAKGMYRERGALLVQPLRQGHGAALAQPDVARYDSLSATGPGLQKTHRLDPLAARLPVPLAARPVSGRAANQAYAALYLPAVCQQWAIVAVVCLRFYAPPPPRIPGQKGCPCLKAYACPRCACAGTTGAVGSWRPSGTTPAGPSCPCAGCCCGTWTGSGTDPHTIVAWFLRRWQLEATFQAVRTHLGAESQHRWSAPAIVRTISVLLGLSAELSWALTPCCGAGP